ncbi:Rad52/Rad22 family DNA repair protein [Nostoc sp. DedQUE07]|uniref:Rad52/Rad22 family DNA repair protein n=1 Tax=Nostoc sp. DedQUE07 TaxID=3075392 RepID=UPI002AD4DC3F|nr:Rad52/Rad22 family DNA repair protein [Nostoc sp. DedQUE07]MDZ8131914.1 hypothetical protein [Nostoc sp. DedQUE07]
MDMETREELRRILSELKKPLPAHLHEFREIPGNNKKWVYLGWQTVRERLEEVCPEWMSDYSEIQYLGNEAICRCAITILGVRKEAIASVPISVISSNGKEMTRGSPPDRLAAEAFKNAAEAWGIGRYLDDQVFTITYLWEQMHKLDDSACGEVRRLSEQYKLQKKLHSQSVKVLKSASPVTLKQPLISEDQRRELWAIARKELRLNDEVTKNVIMGFGCESTRDIPANKYQAVIDKLRQSGKRTLSPTTTKY